MSVMFNDTAFIIVLLRSRKLLNASASATVLRGFAGVGLVTLSLSSFPSSWFLCLSRLSCYSRSDGKFLICSARIYTCSRASSWSFFFLSISACSLAFSFRTLSLMAWSYFSWRSLMAKARAFFSAACLRISSSRFSSNWTLSSSVRSGLPAFGPILLEPCTFGVRIPPLEKFWADLFATEVEVFVSEPPLLEAARVEPLDPWFYLLVADEATVDVSL